MKYCAEGLAVLPENPALLDLRKRTGKEIYHFYSKSLLSGKEETVLLQVENILKLHPKSAVLWMIKSRCLKAMGQIQKGLEAAAMAVHLEPNNADTHFLLGSMMFSAGQFQDAITEYREALRLSQEHRKHAIYSQAGMMNAYLQAVTAIGKHDVIEAASGEQSESILSSRLKGTTEDISQSKVLSEIAGGLME
jgi:tetratricopeptide (TPR) repeat protein